MVLYSIILPSREFLINLPRPALILFLWRELLHLSGQSRNRRVSDPMAQSLPLITLNLLIQSVGCIAWIHPPFPNQQNRQPLQPLMIRYWLNSPRRHLKLAVFPAAALCLSTALKKLSRAPPLLIPP